MNHTFWMFLIPDELSLKKCHLPAHKIVFKKASIKTQNVQDKSAA